MEHNETTAVLLNTTFTTAIPMDVEDTPDCPEWRVPEDYDTYKFWKFINEGVFQVIISIFGLFGNILSIYILTRYIYA